MAPWGITLLVITKRRRDAAFLICCQSFSGHAVICSVKRKQRRKKTRCVAHESAGSVCIEGALMYGPGQSDKRGESWLGWLKSPCWHLRRNPWGEKKGKALIVRRICPCVPSPTASLSLVPSDERSMHQNLPSSEQGPTKKGEFH